jgi:hypothetical protein
MSGEKFEKRFGMVAIEKGFITFEQLTEALEIQITEEIEGANRRLTGQILQDKGYIIIRQIDEVHIYIKILLA